MKVLVTGATSNVGAEIAVTLRERGHDVRAVALPGLPRDHLDRLGIPLHFADVVDESALEPLAADVDAFIHCAGLVDLSRRAKARVLRVNVDGSRTCARVARRAGVRRFVHISSVGVYGRVEGRAKIDEATPTQASGLPYDDSKRAGEAAVRAEVGPLSLTILRPVGIYGLYDRSMTPGLVDALRRGRFAYIGDPTRPCALVGTRFLAEAVSRLLDAPPAPGTEVFLAAEGRAPSMRRLIETIADELGVPPPRHTIPVPLALSAGLLFDALAYLGLRSASAVNHGVVSHAVVDALFDGSALRRRLDLAEVDSLSSFRRLLRARGYSKR